MHGAGKKIERKGEETEVYYLNGIYSKAKSSKANAGINLKELTKRFGSQSITDKLNQTDTHTIFLCCLRPKDRYILVG
jgi:hypothetical protein